MTLGAIPIGIGFATRLPNHDPWASPWTIVGIVIVGIGVLALVWSLVLHLAHDQVAKPMAPADSMVTIPREDYEQYKEFLKAGWTEDD